MRARIGFAFGSASLVCVALQIAWSNWVEVVFRVDPDQHSGLVEWAAPLLFVTVAVTAWASTFMNEKRQKSSRTVAHRVRESDLG